MHLCSVSQLVTAQSLAWLVMVNFQVTSGMVIDLWEAGCRYASTCQTVGMNLGYFASFTVFLALNDAGFCNRYLRSHPSPVGVLSLAGVPARLGLGLPGDHARHRRAQGRA